MKGYRVFTRTWWKNNTAWPNGLEPCAGRKTTICRHCDTVEQARQFAQEYNRTHSPGRLSRKAEFESK